VRPDYIREKLYDDLKNQDRSQSSSLLNKKNMLKLKRALGTEALSKSVNRRELRGNY